MVLKLALRALVVASTFVLASATSASATTTIDHAVPFDAVVAGCTEDIHLSGTLLFVGTETATPSGGFMVSFHFQPYGLTGVGLTSGKKYIGTGLTREITVFSPPGGITDTFVNQFHIVATAGAKTYDVREVFHLTVKPNGEVVVVIDKLFMSC